MTLREAHGASEVALQRLGEETCVVSLRGEVDLSFARDLSDLLVEAIGSGARQIVIDLVDTAFIDSTILGVLVHTRKRMLPEGARMTLVCRDGRIRRLFDITGLSVLFEMVETLPIVDELRAPAKDRAPTESS